MSRYLFLDVASTPIDNAAEYLEPVHAPSTWKDQAKIDAYVADKTAERTAGAGLDLDLARIAGIGLHGQDGRDIWLCKTEDQERDALRSLGLVIQEVNPCIVTYNGFSFDIPLLMRRARYLDVPFPKISTDRFKSSHADLMLELTDRDPSRRRSLGFYVRRLGWSDLVKPLSGAEEARVPQTGQWDELAASIAHDLEATKRLAAWLGYHVPAVKGEAA